MVCPPKVFHKLIIQLSENRTESKKYENQIFRGITNVMPGYWTIVGVTREALSIMESRGWVGNFTKGLRRDHIKSAKSFQEIMLSNSYSYEEFVALTQEYGKCVLCTKSQNPPNRAGFGNAFGEKDVVWIPQDKVFDTAQEISLKSNKERAFFFRSLLSL